MARARGGALELRPLLFSRLSLRLDWKAATEGGCPRREELGDFMEVENLGLGLGLGLEPVGPEADTGLGLGEGEETGLLNVEE